METTLKASELRIGNLVYIDGIQPIGNVTITAVMPDDIYYNLFLKTDYVDFLRAKMCYLKPIPLTEEWLVGFGFIKRPNSEFVQYWEHGWFELYHEYSRDEPFFTVIPFLTRQNKFTYVHQLQNLYFALTGEELILDSKKD